MTGHSELDRGFCTHLVEFIVFCVVTFPSISAAAESRDGEILPTIQEIEQVWKTRQQKILSLDVSMHTIQFRSVLAPAVGMRPEADLMANGEARFILDSKDRIRFDLTDKKWSSMDEAAVDQVMQHVWANGIETIVEVKGDKEFPSAHIMPQVVNAGDMIFLKPLLMFSRILDDDLRFFDPDKALNVKPGPNIDGISCVSVSQVDNSGTRASTLTVYIDPAREFLPVRYERHVGSQRKSSVQIEKFEKHTTIGWFPVAWKVVSMYSGSGEPIWVDTVAVNSYKINEPVDAQLFQLVIPEGAWVNNYVTKEKYIKTQGGDKREILPNEYNGTNYAELLTSEPGQTLGVNALSNTTRNYWLMGLNVILVVLLGYVVVRRWQKY